MNRANHPRAVSPFTIVFVIATIPVFDVCFGAQAGRNPDAPGTGGAAPNREARPPAITNSIGMKLIFVPAGEFTMGSPEGDDEADANEKPQHKARIGNPFYLAETEVTQGQWKSVMGTKPWDGKPMVKDGSDYPATYVSWDDAVEFCARLGSKEGMTYRLPTEAEWEYACRAGTNGVYHFGDDSSDLGQYAWFRTNTWDVEEKYAHPVGQKKPNAFGLRDMHGNVWEWCQDKYDSNYNGASARNDTSASAEGTPRVFRGGCWFYKAWFSRSAVRLGYMPSLKDSGLGFRVACCPPKE